MNKPLKWRWLCGFVKQIGRYVSLVLTLLHIGLTKLFKEKRVKKTYLAWVVGVPYKKERTIDAPLLKKLGDNEKVIVSPKGKDAIMEINITKKLLKPKENNSFSTKTTAVDKI